ncbi:hypothetical protein Gotri_027571 [Gossypium trilobum]|uniref:Uncharacterized protein n=1 Tax=Gossypium trilobum TaxID=34281 RepID=A0A7J9FLD5_9ROSI|nr:hypothetical protein [Gossypium trilobum]
MIPKDSTVVPAVEEFYASFGTKNLEKLKDIHGK